VQRGKSAEVKELVFRQVVLALPEFLTPELAQTLAVLKDAPPSAAELLIGTMAEADRKRLRDAGAILGGEPSALEGWTEVKITDYGRQVIAKCSQRYPATPESEQRAKAELEQARAEYIANGGKLPEAKRGFLRLLGNQVRRQVRAAISGNFNRSLG
jgi:hypothetical protein